MPSISEQSWFSKSNRAITLRAAVRDGVYKGDLTNVNDQRKIYILDVFN